MYYYTPLDWFIFLPFIHLHVLFLVTGRSCKPNALVIKTFPEERCEMVVLDILTLEATLRIQRAVQQYLVIMATRTPDMLHLGGDITKGIIARHMPHRNSACFRVILDVIPMVAIVKELSRKVPQAPLLAFSLDLPHLKIAG